MTGKMTIQIVLAFFSVISYSVLVVENVFRKEWLCF